MPDSTLSNRALHDLVDGLALIDAHNRVALWNPRAEEFLHCPSSDMLGHSTDEMIECIAARTATPDTVSVQLYSAFAARDSDYPLQVEITLVSPTRATLSAQFFVLRDDVGKRIGAGLILRNVTREREADAMKSQLLSTVSHELRTPLASIKGFATTLLRQDVKWDDATQRDFLRIIEEESDRLTEIINNLLDMSQLEVGALRVEREPIQLRALIRDIVDEMRMRTEAHYFVTDLPAVLPRVHADSRRIRQVLRNLLENAIKYTKGGQIAVMCEVENDHVLVSVSDQGDGIPPRYLSKIFERFFQVDGASTRRVGGSGLGLAISRGIIEAHGGKIWAENAAPHGSIFRFTLPLVLDEPNE
ncbi:two-component system, OmpR family, phosphate regulon sensor histidine kinase PhoR [Anaerolineae bacterium]|nr:two-component system, OmpR family, phosphate regulon sensor histidine kinase PhoR [Anaerolineae bacterium]